MRPLLYALLLFFTLTTCDSAPDAPTAAETAQLTAQEAAYETMVEGHDRAMGMMGQIVQAQRTIAEQMAIPGLPEEHRELLAGVREQLEDANDGMMDWMNEWQTLEELREEEDHDDIMEYIQEQNRSVAQVEANIKSAVATANEVLGMGSGTHTHDDGTTHDHDHNH